MASFKKSFENLKGTSQSAVKGVTDTAGTEEGLKLGHNLVRNGDILQTIWLDLIKKKKSFLTHSNVAN